MNFHRITPELIVGSCLQTPADLDRLRDEEGVGTVYCLQQDKDMAYFDLDVGPIQARAAERGDIKHKRFEIVDFDPHDLRLRLPGAIATLLAEADLANGPIYVHCTAGMGRAPGVALAYMYWVLGMDLNEAHARLTTIRPCHPKLFSIRNATADLLTGGEPVPVSVTHKRGTAGRVQVAGLDVGWNTLLDLELASPGRFGLTKPMLPGKYPFKYVVDGRWTYSADVPTVRDGDHVNNYVEVARRAAGPAEAAQIARLLSEEAVLLPAEREALLAKLRELPPE